MQQSAYVSDKNASVVITSPTSKKKLSFHNIQFTRLKTLRKKSEHNQGILYSKHSKTVLAGKPVLYI